MFTRTRVARLQSRRKMRRWRRKKRRGRMLPAEATALSTRSRLPWPITNAVTRQEYEANRAEVEL